ncbi:imidazole glycerol phosphate synthase subunit HisH [uncultured Sulfitobacter sp.]|uniref:imidazole glycerol phosphate synthase subunit HisH n=1 Tax=uncultured Sulfitobacter sp. TaxID=191468 RepID=UPI0030D9FE47|tara:strand:- start:66480 stop:67109 length:630 start_codon:yes stop_codon:yes gene_type:complete
MKTKTIAVIDYGMGNIRSVENALHQVCSHDIVVTNIPAEILAADMILLPGVGAFPDAMRRLNELGLVPVLNEAVLEMRKPTLGICLGMQLLFDVSHEKQPTQGLGWVPGEVVPIEASEKIRVPHVGWNSLIVAPNDAIFGFLKHDKDYYFVHSYVAKCNPMYVLAQFEYGDQMIASVKNDNVIGMQFHPEKSQFNGLETLKSVLHWAGL